MSPTQDERIRLQPATTPVRVAYSTIAVADTARAIRLEERGYPPRLYIPRADIDAGLLRESATRTRCPFKGEATYYHLRVDGDVLEDAAWSYEQPQAAVAAIAGHLSFDHPRLSPRVEED